MSEGDQDGNSTRVRRGSLFATLHPVVSLFSTGGMVLAYHGIRDAVGAAAGSMHVSAARFAATVHAVSAVATHVPLRDLLLRHGAGKPTKGLVAITFDDAYASVVASAWRIIADGAIPVTLLVVSSGAATGAPFWWDRLDESFARASPARWRAFEDACGLPAVFRMGQPPQMGRLRPFRQWILAEHRGRWPAALEVRLAELEVELGCHASQRPLRFDELAPLLSNSQVDVAPHSVAHPVLPLLPDDEIRRELRTSFDELRARYPAPVPVLAPPFGLYDERTVRIGREQGLDWCLTLEATLLDDLAPGAFIPRIGMTARHQPWKAVLAALGCWKGVRARRSSEHCYPDLPSATS